MNCTDRFTARIDPTRFRESDLLAFAVIIERTETVVLFAMCPDRLRELNRIDGLSGVHPL